MAKALISPGYGAGWSTRASDKYRRDFLFDEKLIAAVERGCKQSDIDDFERRMLEKYGEFHEYLGGARDLEVVEVDGPFTVDEYDGSESLVFPGGVDWIAP